MGKQMKKENKQFYKRFFWLAFVKTRPQLPEIQKVADTLGMSPEGVLVHVKQIYDELSFGEKLHIAITMHVMARQSLDARTAAAATLMEEALYDEELRLYKEATA